MTDHRFTVVCEFDGGTYVSQVSGRDEREALAAWSDDLLSTRPMGDDASLIAAAVVDDPDTPTPLAGLEGVSCWTANIDNRLVLAHIILST